MAGEVSRAGEVICPEGNSSWQIFSNALKSKGENVSKYALGTFSCNVIESQ